jgi:autotransporter-associated beta strand protein
MNQCSVIRRSNLSLYPRRRPGTRRRPLSLSAAALAAFAFATTAPAATIYWAGDNNALWNTTAGANGTNWSSLAGNNSGTLGVPGATDDVFFNIPGALNLNTVLGQDFSIRSLTFLPAATNPVTIGGANTLTVGTGGLTSNSNAVMTLNTNVALGATQTWANNTATAVTVNGIISGIAGNGLTIGGSGAYTFTGANTYFGSTTVFTGTLNLSGANGSIQNTSAIALGAGTVLNLNSTGANHASQNRIGDATGIASSGGFINLLGNSSAATTETVGTLTTASGATYVTVTPGAGQTATLTFGTAGTVPSFNHSMGGTVTFSNTGTVMAPNVTLVNPVNPIIGGWATIGTVNSPVSNTLDWATVNGANQVVPLATYQILTTAAAATDNAKANFSAGQVTFANAGSATINSLYVTGNSGPGTSTNDASQIDFISADPTVQANRSTFRITVTSGGILCTDAGGTGHYDNKLDTPNMAFIGPNNPTPVNNNLCYQGQITSGFFPTVDTAELDVFTSATGNLRIASFIVDPDATHRLTLVKSGPGLLDISNGNTQNRKQVAADPTFTGKIVINEGILLINAAPNLGASAAASDNVTFNGGELRTFAGLSTNSAQGWTVGTRGGTFSYTGGGTSAIQNKITGVGGFTFYTRAFGGGTNQLINLNNAAQNNDYQGATNFFFSYGAGNGGTDTGRVAWLQNNQVPASSAVTLSMVDDATRNVVANTINKSADLAGRTDHFGSLAGNVNLRNFNNTLTIGANNLSTVYNGSLYGAAAQGGNNGDTSFPAGTGTLVKVGSGTQTLAGTINLYTGPTNINGGTLLIGSGTGITSSASLGTGPVNVGNGTLTGALGGNGTISGAVTVSSTGHLAPAMSASTSNTLTINNSLTINAGATLDYNFGAAGTPGTGDLINLVGTGNLLMNAGADILNITPLAGFGIGTYNLITVSGSGTFTDNATFTINGSTLFNYAVLKPNDAIDPTAGGGTVPLGQLRLQVTAGNPNFFWTGAVNGAWDVNTTANWTGAGTKFTTGGNVTFDDVNLSVAPPGATTITVAAGGVSANSILFNNAVNNYTLGGAAITVTAGAGVTKNQAGTVTLNGSLTAPLTTITAGSLNVGVGGTLASAQVKVSGGTLSVAGALGSTTALNVGGTATFTSAAQTIASLTNDSGITTGVVNLNGPTNLTIGTGAFDGTISGAGSLSKNTTATLTLTNVANNFTGGVAILNGTLSVPTLANAGLPQPLGANPGPVTLGDIATAGRLQYTGLSASTNRAISLAAGGGSVEVTTAGEQLTLSGPVANGASTLTLLGAGNGLLTTPLLGTGNLTKQGAGTWTLAGLGAPSGATAATTYDIQAGTLTAMSDGVLSTLGAAGVTLSGGTLGLSSTGFATFDNAVNVTQNSTVNAFLSVPGGGFAGQPVILGGTKNVTIAAARTLNLTTADNYSLVTAGNISGAGAVTANGNISMSGAANTYGGATTVNGGTFNLVGALNTGGAVVVNNASVFNQNGTLSAGSISANGSSTFNATQPTSVTGLLTVNGGTFNAGATITAGSVSISGGTYNGNATLISAGTFTVGGGTANINVSTGLGNGPINVTSGLLKVDVGFANTATYSGPSVVNDGRLQIASGTLDLGNTVVTTTKPHAIPGIAGQLNEVFFTPANAGVADFNSGANGDPLITFDNNNNFLTRVPGGTGVLGNTNLNFTGNAIQLRAGALFPATDQEGAAWHGNLTVGGPNLPAGPISFGTSSDDGSTLYIDLNQNGAFEAGERVISNFGSHGVVAVVNTVTLAAGTYRFATGWFNGNGGLQTDVTFAPGSGLPIGSQTFVNPGSPTQAGIFSSPSTPGGRIQIDPGATLSAGGFTADAITFTNGGIGTLVLKNNAAPVVSAADSVTLNGTGGQATLDFGINNTASIVAVNLGTSGTLTKTGNGILAVTGTGTGTGTLAIGGGTVIVNGSLSGAVSVNAGTLRGTGTIGALTLTGGSIEPGNGPGILNVGDTNLTSGTLALEIAGGGVGSYDRLNVAGGVALNGPITLTLNFSAYDPQDNVDTFVIVNNDFGDGIALNGAASRLMFGATQLNEGTTFLATSGAFTQQFRVSYLGGDGNDITLAAIPEPGSVVLLLGGLASVCALRRRRRD